MSDFLNSLFVSVFGMSVVFFALILLIAMINLISFAMKTAKSIQRKHEAAVPAAGLAPASVSAPPVAEAPARRPEGPTASARVVPALPTELRLTGVDEKTAALIMAIVCDESGLPPEELYFKSISLVET